MIGGNFLGFVGILDYYCCCKQNLLRDRNHHEILKLKDYPIWDDFKHLIVLPKPIFKIWQFFQSSFTTNYDCFKRFKWRFLLQKIMQNFILSEQYSLSSTAYLQPLKCTSNGHFQPKRSTWNSKLKFLAEELSKIRPSCNQEP